MDKSILVNAWNNTPPELQDILKRVTPWVFAVHMKTSSVEINQYSLDQILPVCTEFILNNYS